jgi:hypothetical protein
VLQFNPVTGLPRGRSTASRLPVALGLGSLSGLNAPPAQLFGNRGGLGADTSGALAATLGSPAGTITPTVSAPPRTLAVAPPGTAPPGTAPTLAPPASGPDLQRLIESDPLYHQTVLDIDAQRAADKAGLAAQRQGALVQYGAIPDLTNSLGLVGDDLPGEITDTIRQLAQQNTSAGLSTTARLQQAYQDLVGQTKNDLTARGLLSSGETGYQLGRAQLGFTQQQSDALQQLLSTLAGYENGYLGNESARIAALRQSAGEAAGRIPTTTTVTPQDAIDDLTQPTLDGLYTPPGYGPDGLYTPNGTRNQDGTLTDAGGGTYRSGGGKVTYQSNTGKYGYKPLQ